MSLAQRLLLRSFQQQAVVAQRFLASEVTPSKTDVSKGVAERITFLGQNVPSHKHPKDPEVKGLFDRLGTLWVPPEKELKKWRYVPADYKEFPERDLVNFPHPQVKQFPAQTRMAIFPDSWFKFFYNKTGETGGYLFLGGMGMYLFSKEVVVFDFSMMQTVNYSLMVILAYYFVGKSMAELRNSYQSQTYEGLWEWEAWQRQQHSNVIEEAKKALESAKQVHALLYDAKRENVALQLEAAYRQRIQSIYEEVKKRVEFLAEYESTKRRFEQQHMIDWIMKQVRASITPQMEAATLKQCIADLKALSQKS